MAKPSKKLAKAAARPAPVRRHSRFSFDAEDSTRLMLVGATALVVLIALAVVAFGYYDSVIKPRGRTVMQVGEVKVSYSAMKRRLAYEFEQNPSYQERNALAAVPFAAYQNLLEELTLVQRAESDMGVTVTPEEEAAKLRQKAGVSDTASDAEFGDRYRVVLANSHLHDDEYRRIARAEILEQKVKDKIKEQTPATLTQAKLEVLSLPDEPSARAARERVLAGEDWATVAKEVSQDSNVAETGGVKDYAPQGAFPPAYDDFAFSAPIGEISDVRIDPSQEMTNATSFYVVRVVDRVDRALTDEQRPSYETRAYQKWLTDTQEALTVVDKWSDDTQAQVDALDPLFARVAELEQQRQQPQEQPPVVVTVPASSSSPAPAETPAAQGAPTEAAPVGQPPTPAAAGTASSGQ